MSKPISISFGKSKSSLPSTSSSTNVRKSVAFNGVPSSTFGKPALLRPESDDEDETTPLHESVTGFASDGAILTRPVQEKEAQVIGNPGNGNWRTRRKGGGRNILPEEVRAQTNGNAGAAVVERDEVSKASGLQLAQPSASEDKKTHVGNTVRGEDASSTEPVKQRTEDEIALQALLSDGTGERKSSAVILQTENANTSRDGVIDEAEDFRADVASRPDSCTLDEYAAMPVEEFGMALLRGMGQKRKANGQIINYGDGQSNGSTAPKVREPRQGYLGIGAKVAPGAEVELGAWGKAAMRKNKKGEGLYTPVMLRDKRTGEMLTEEELEARKREAQGKSKGSEEDWRDRRDRNLERSGRDGEQKRLTDKDNYRDQMSAFSRNSSSGKERDGYESPRNGSTKRDRSRSRDRRRRDDSDRDEKHEYRDRDREKEKEKDRRRDKYRDDDRYDSSSSRKSSHRERERERDRQRPHKDAESGRRDRY